MRHRHASRSVIRLAGLLLLPVVVLILQSRPLPAFADNGITAMNLNSYTDAIGASHLVGEVRNDTGQTIEFLDIVATFNDASGNFLATADAYSTLDILQPSAVSPFDILVTDPPAGIASYQLQMQWQPASDTSLTGLTILSNQVSNDGIGCTHIQGQVRNDSGSPAQFVEVIATFYQANGTVASVDTGFTTLDQLAPGETSPYEVLSCGSLPLAHYRLQIQGQPA